MSAGLCGYRYESVGAQLRTNIESETARFNELMGLGNQRFVQPPDGAKGGVVYIPKTVPFWPT
jgi:hypothetical protein